MIVTIDIPEEGTDVVLDAVCAAADRYPLALAAVGAAAASRRRARRNLDWLHNVAMARERLTAVLDRVTGAGALPECGEDQLLMAAVDLLEVIQARDVLAVWGVE